MSEQNVLVLADCALAGSAPALNTPPLQTVHICENEETCIISETYQLSYPVNLHQQ
jgi:hypothetical protein